MVVVVEEMMENRLWEECDGQGCTNLPRLNLVTEVQWGLSETLREGGETVKRLRVFCRMEERQRASQTGTGRGFISP
jgi:hypothetical protein